MELNSKAGEESLNQLERYFEAVQSSRARIWELRIRRMDFAEPKT